MSWFDVVLCFVFLKLTFGFCFSALSPHSGRVINSSSKGRNLSDCLTVCLAMSLIDRMFGFQNRKLFRSGMIIVWLIRNGLLSRMLLQRFVFLCSFYLLRLLSCLLHRVLSCSSFHRVPFFTVSLPGSSQRVPSIRKGHSWGYLRRQESYHLRWLESCFCCRCFHSGIWHAWISSVPVSGE